MARSGTHHFIYLHGFASSPHSAKGVDLQHRLQAQGLDLLIPDLNQGDFTHLTLTRQIQQVSELIRDLDQPVILIGSSLGGLVAAWLGEGQPQIQSLILLAPAFRFLDHWLGRLGSEQIQQWQIDGIMPVFHYGENQTLPLDYGFLTDARGYRDANLRRPLPTLILHGIHDEVIPVESSREYARDRSWVELIELDSDHSLSNASEPIWNGISTWCQWS